MVARAQCTGSEFVFAARPLLVGAEPKPTIATPIDDDRARGASGEQHA